MIDKQVFIDRARYLQKPVPSEIDIESVLSNYNEEVITQSFQNKIEVIIWDGISNINAASPDYIAKENPWIDKAYIISIDNQITYFQTHEPFVTGIVPLTADSISEVSNNHASIIAVELAKNQIIQAVMKDLGLE